MRRRQQGFTLIEAAVAIAVVAILSGIIVPLVVKNLNDARRARALNDLQVIAGSIASQLKDTGRRPSGATGPNLAGGGGASTGSGGTLWGSAGVAITGFTVPAGNTFVNLFTANSAVGAQNTAANALFQTTVNAEFSYRGPYLASDVATKSDPWGNKYIILGYNANGQTANGPIWVACAGPNGQILAANLNAGNGPAGAWNQGGVSSDDLVFRVN